MRPKNDEKDPVELEEEEYNYDPYRDTIRQNRKLILASVFLVVVFFVVFLLHHFGLFDRLVMNLILAPITLVCVIAYLVVKNR